MTFSMISGFCMNTINDEKIDENKNNKLFFPFFSSTINIATESFNSTKRIENLNDFDDEIYICHECGSYNIIIDKITGDKICSNCGMIIEEKNLVSLPKRRYRNSVKEEMIHHAIMTENKPTIMSIKDFNNIKGRNRLKLLKLNKINQQKNNLENRQIQIFALIKKYANYLHFNNNIIRESKFIYNSLLKKKSMYGLNIDKISVALLHISASKLNMPIPLKEISKQLRKNGVEITKSDIYKSKKYIIDIAKNCNKEKIVKPNDDKHNYIKFIVQQLKIKKFDLKVQLINKSIELFESIKNQIRFEGSTTSIIPAVIYTASQLNNIKISTTNLYHKTYTSSQRIKEKYELIKKILKPKEF